MDLTLTRTKEGADGVYGELVGDDLSLVTLEHAYPVEGGFAPKIPPGTYTCRRGLHRLHGKPPFETFEVMGVEGHSGLLFHAGNFNRDSQGCILLGCSIAFEMITRSLEAFNRFMEAQADVDSFTLTVRGAQPR